MTEPNPPDRLRRAEEQELTGDLGTLLARAVDPTHTSDVATDRALYGALDPDAVCWPGSADEVAALLRLASQRGLAVAVAGASTRADWPQRSDRPCVALDTRRMRNILRLDETSLIAYSQGGIELHHLEQALHRQDLTLGAYPARVLRSTLGGLLAAPPLDAYSPRHGPLSEACIGLTAATPDGELIRVHPCPRRATGPDLARLYIGSRGAFGVIVEAALRVYRRPEHTRASTQHYPDGRAATLACRVALARGVRPARCQVLLNRAATAALDPNGGGVPAALALSLEGPEEATRLEQAIVDEIARELGGGDLPREFADRWLAASTEDDGEEQRPARCCARVRYSELDEPLGRLAEQLAERSVAAYLDELTRHGAHLWLEPVGADQAATEPTELAGLLRDAGLQPADAARWSGVSEQLRQQLDPSRVLLTARWH